MKLTLPFVAESPLVMVTAYDFPSARLAEAAGIDLLLVGDSLGNVVLGYESTAQVSLEEMIHHARAARRGAPDTFLVVDMPFGSYHTGLEDGLRNAVRLIRETQADALKLEGATIETLKLIDTLTRNGVPVIGHVGLLPQTAIAQGGLKVQGKDEHGAHAVLHDAKALQEAGVCAVVLEAIPARLAARVTQALHVPTIGIGAGVACGGQVLVWHDLLGIYEDDHKKISKRYADVGQITREALIKYREEVQSKTFPTKEHSFVIKDEVLNKLY